LLVQSDGTQPFEGTYFDAAIDACDDDIWPLEWFEGSLNPRYQTQRRHLKRAAMLLGLDASIQEWQREKITHLLSIPGQVIRENAALIEKQNKSILMGSCICKLLNEIPLSTSIFERIAQVGALAGIWPSPIRWNRTTRSYHPLFQQVRTRGSPA
jgi:hypothetical protein